MDLFMNDTSPEIQKLYHNLLMQKSNEERFLMGISLCHTVRQIVLSSFSERDCVKEKRVELLHRYYSHDLSKEEQKNIEKCLLKK